MERRADVTIEKICCGKRVEIQVAKEDIRLSTNAPGRSLDRE
jgi:hypothetical protein